VCLSFEFQTLELIAAKGMGALDGLRLTLCASKATCMETVRELSVQLGDAARTVLEGATSTKWLDAADIAALQNGAPMQTALLGAQARCPKYAFKLQYPMPARTWLESLLRCLTKYPKERPTVLMGAVSDSIGSGNGHHWVYTIVTMDIPPVVTAASGNSDSPTIRNLPADATERIVTGTVGSIGETAARIDAGSTLNRGHT
jgi:hypothetical protein